MTLVSKIMAEIVVIFKSHFDSSQKHIELRRISGFNFGLAIEVKLD
jgi:hypothetical protein